MIDGVIDGFLYWSEADVGRNETVCKLIARARFTDNGFGIEPTFKVRFSDGFERDVLAQQLTPWYPT